MQPRLDASTFQANHWCRRKADERTICTEGGEDLRLDHFIEPQPRDMGPRRVRVEAGEVALANARHPR